MAGERGACPEAACSHHSLERAVRHDVVSCRVDAANKAGGGAKRVRGSVPALCRRLYSQRGSRTEPRITFPVRWGLAGLGPARFQRAQPRYDTTGSVRGKDIASLPVQTRSCIGLMTALWGPMGGALVIGHTEPRLIVRCHGHSSGTLAFAARRRPSPIGPLVADRMRGD